MCFSFGNGNHGTAGIKFWHVSDFGELVRRPMAYSGPMLPAPDICRRARLARDLRFDGHFVVGVLTTGVFCRPICPARPSAEENVRYFATSAAAMEAGYRPCLRCRPERENSLPAWTIGSETVVRAVRMIDNGYLAGHPVRVLAAELGVGQRHLNRLFRAELGTTPKGLARMRRIALAKRLVDETHLAMADVARAAGYGSIRRFNDEFSRVFRHPPRAARRKRPTAGSSHIGLRMPTREPFNADWVFSFLGRRALPNLESMHGHTYRRRIGDHCISVSRRNGALWLEVPGALADGTADVLARVRRVFDLDADPNAIDSHLLESPECAPWVRVARGIRVPGAWDAFEGAVRAILGQQVSINRSADLAARLVERFGTGGFPSPAALASADVGAIGIPGARAGAVRYLARAVLERGDAFLLDAPAARETLLGIDGIGPWTAEYVAMRVARDPDAFPASDRAVRKVLGANVRDALRRAAPWRPWRAYAIMHLWRGYSATAEHRSTLHGGTNASRERPPPGAVDPWTPSGAGPEPSAGQREGIPLAEQEPGPKAPHVGH